MRTAEGCTLQCTVEQKEEGEEMTGSRKGALVWLKGVAVRRRFVSGTSAPSGEGNEWGMSAGCWRFCSADVWLCMMSVCTGGSKD